jgi:hypothetical protein
MVSSKLAPAYDFDPYVPHARHDAREGGSQANKRKGRPESPLSKREEPPRVLMSDAGGSRTNAYNLSAWLCRFVVGGRACCQPRQEALVRIELVVAGTGFGCASRPPFADAFVGREPTPVR